jgi:spore coat protein U-like protein
LPCPHPAFNSCFSDFNQSSGIVARSPLEAMSFGQGNEIMKKNFMIRCGLIATSSAFALVCACGSGADAATAGSSFPVTATVVNSCIVAASSLAFPTYTPTSATVTTGSTTLNVTCTLGAPYTVALSNGSGTGADATAGASGRKMTGPGSAQLGYNLYQDSSYAQAWGSSGAYLMSASGTGLQVPLTVYGAIPASQVVAAGNFTDTINVTISF